MFYGWETGLRVTGRQFRYYCLFLLIFINVQVLLVSRFSWGGGFIATTAGAWHSAGVK